MRIGVMRIGVMRILIRIRETTSGGGFDAYSPRRSGFACNHVID